jgi:hypothetical protein
MKRRAVLVTSVNAALVLALAMAGTSGVAQRPAQPVARPPRPSGPIGAGRFPAVVDSVIRTQPPGVFVVRAVTERDNIVQLSDADGRTANVYVDADVFDVSELKPGDEVVVDFVVPENSNARLVAAAVWRK